MSARNMILIGLGIVGLIVLNSGLYVVSEWEQVVRDTGRRQGKVNIAMVGKYVDLTESYKSLSEALIHAGIHTLTNVAITYVDSEKIEQQGTAVLEGVDAILVPGGFGHRGVEGKILAAQYAREGSQ